MTTAAARRIPVRYLSLLVGSLGMQGVDTTGLLRDAGLEASRFDNIAEMLAPAEVEAFLTSAYHLTGRTDLGFEAGRLIKLNSHDILGYAMLSCRNVDHLLALTSRYYHFINPLFSMRYRRLADVGGEAVFNPVAAMPLRTMYFVMEAIAVSVQNQFILLFGADSPAFDVRMGMPVPAHRLRYLELLPARFHFDEGAMPAVTLQIGVRSLELPLPMASPATVEQIEKQLSASTRRPAPHGGWTEYITMLLRETDRQLTLDEIAGRMNISARTIDRNLKKEHLQFRDLAQQVRFERAQSLLARPGATVSGVAQQLGFSDAANFTRAFRRHSGLTPTDFLKTLPVAGSVG
ncbi:helix-turn-helix domain-containing protein [Variovorax soli]|uniref:helix-turn-helix domain-containing protein n=1 Tax=Variovorax soli TaxID=376815 RepID=UPI000AAA17DA|nr:AraC family transcriptional regulator [Variovorax soli]